MEYFHGALLNRLAFQDGAFRCTARVLPGEPLLALPLSKCWTAETARRGAELSGLDPELPDSVWLALHLLQKRPALAEKGQPGLLLWDDTELSELTGSLWLPSARLGREDIIAEYHELVEVIDAAVLGQLGVTEESYLWAQATKERCSLHFLDADSNPVDILLPALTLLESNQVHDPEFAAGLARLEVSPEAIGPLVTKVAQEEKEQLLVFYAPEAFEAGAPVYLCHGGLAACHGRVLLERGKVSWGCLELAMELPVQPSKELKEKAAALQPDPPAPGEFLPTEVLAGWTPALLEEEQKTLKLNVRFSKQRPVPRRELELLQAALGGGRAKEALLHGLRSIEELYVDSKEAETPRRKLARALIQEEKQLLGFAKAALEDPAAGFGGAPSRAPGASETDASGKMEVALLRLEGTTCALRRITAVFAALPCDAEAGPLMQELQALRAALAGFPEGNPESVYMRPVAHTSDPALAAHGEATEAVLRARLAACCWEISKLAAERAEPVLMAGVLGEAAVMHLRLLEFQEAHEKLQLSLAASYNDRAFRLERWCQMTLACHAGLCVSGDGWAEAVRSVGEQLQERLRRAGYTEAALPEAAGVPSILHLVSSRGYELECQMQERGSPQDLVDMIRLWVLRRFMPQDRVRELLGPELLSGLLRLQVLAALRVPDDDSPLVFSTVALWPLEGLLVATDYGDIPYDVGEFEPVMYLSLDSYALIAAAPRRAAERVLDVCCGSGVQGMVALSYAREVTFVDVNERALSFSRFNCALNGLYDRASFVRASVEDLSELEPPFQVILANPPFVPNPDGAATAAGPLYSGGGSDGEMVHRALLQKAGQLLAPGGLLCTVAEVPNPEKLADRVVEWIGEVSAMVKIFLGDPAAAENYWKVATQERSALERSRYLRGLQRLNISSVAQALVLLRKDGTSTVEVTTRSQLWSDDAYLRGHVASSILPKKAGYL
ncbi:unnamed protein product [Effrenium voratum]|uniref:Methyltransferase small domain-containing protein n=1 Tax=Effrenium voratum TaxID=2562239 RepID=A0AA36J4T5_9DINO|nr:unnamed protein product [Effrenium voratum]CAJ1419953.1 unnamed protein product [Effrenium voratum]